MTSPPPLEREPASDRWLLLIHQLPPKPAYFRVKIWRRLQMLGSVAIKSSVYALPLNEETQEDFEWLLREIEEGGGEGSLCEARFIDGLSDAQVDALFNAAREADYEELAKEARDVAETMSGETSTWQESTSELQSKCVRLRKRLAEIERIDFFGANSREGVAGLLAGIEERLAAVLARTESETAEMPAPESFEDDLKGKVWVTRRGVYVDRIACAWLIRRFVDPDARFKFVAHKGYKPEPGELRFDMFEAEFTHKGDSCSFEVLLDRVRLCRRLSRRQIAASLGIGPTAAGACLRRAREAGISWPLPDDLGDDALERRLYPWQPSASKALGRKSILCRDGLALLWDSYLPQRRRAANQAGH